MKSLKQIKEQIKSIAGSLFELEQLDSLISKFESLIGDEKLIDCIIQVSTDEGNELEVGFFTETRIVDVTLSNGKVYFYAYPVSAIKSINMTDVGSKWTLAITGEKKFDYNVVKPGITTALSKYAESLQEYIELHN
jgi:hypothetical protein